MTLVRGDGFFSFGNDLLAGLGDEDPILRFQTGLFDDEFVSSANVTPLLDTADEDTEITFWDKSARLASTTKSLKKPTFELERLLRVGLSRCADSLGLFTAFATR